MPKEHIELYEIKCNGRAKIEPKHQDLRLFGPQTANKGLNLQDFDHVLAAVSYVFLALKGEAKMRHDFTLCRFQLQREQKGYGLRLPKIRQRGLSWNQHNNKRSCL